MSPPRRPSSSATCRIRGAGWHIGDTCRICDVGPAAPSGLPVLARLGHGLGTAAVVHSVQATARRLTVERREGAEMGISDLYAFADASGGPVRLRDAAQAAGLSRRAVERHVERTGWQRHFRGVAAPAGTPRDPRSLARHAVTAVGPPVAVTRWSAAYLLGLRGAAPSAVQLLVPARRRPALSGPLEVSRSRCWTPADVAAVDGIPVVSPAWLLIELAGVCSAAVLRGLAIDVRARLGLDLERLLTLVRGLGPVSGRGRLVDVLEDVLAVGRVDAPWELQVRAAFADAGIVFDHGQVPSRGPTGLVIHHDLGIRSICFALELNGFGSHSSPADLARDAERATLTALSSEDWRIVPITWHGWQRDRDHIIEDVRDVIRAQSERHLGRPWPTAADLVTAPGTA